MRVEKILAVLNLWVPVVGAALASWVCWAAGAEIKMSLSWDLGDDSQLPLVSRWFIGSQIWIYLFPLPFVLLAGVAEWKGWSEAGRTLIVRSVFAATMGFFALFALAAILPFVKIGVLF